MRSTVPSPMLLSLSLLLVASFFPPALATVNLTSVSLSVIYDRSTYLVLGDVALAYQLEQPSVTFSSSVSLDAASYTGVQTGSIDYGLTTLGLSDTEAIASPDISMFPILFSAVVPIYRLDSLTTGVQLVLSRTNLALIYMGVITWWNDSRLAADNSAVTLPPTPILVVFHNESVGMNGVFTHALNKFNANYSLYATVSDTPSFPTWSYSAYSAVTGATAVVAAVISTDGAIGYAAQSVAQELGVNVAAMINKAGKVVQPSAETVTFAAVELGTQTLTRTTSPLDLTDGSGSSVWPICVASSAALPTLPHLRSPSLHCFSPHVSHPHLCQVLHRGLGELAWDLSRPRRHHQLLAVVLPVHRRLRPRR